MTNVKPFKDYCKENFIMNSKQQKKKDLKKMFVKK